jgi:methylenetetrahydrofolate reductase (NADPH)
MPLTDPKQIEKFSALAGAPMPTTVRDYFVSATANSDDTAKRGVEFATDFAQKLIAGGAPGIHLYTMNKSAAAKQVSLNLKS